MLIGAVAGLGVVRWLDVPLVPIQGVHDTIGWLLIGASTILATLPDIDEPHAWISQRVRELLTVAGGALGIIVGVFVVLGATLPPWLESALPMSLRWYLPALCGLGGLVIGRLLAVIALRMIRRSSGGHRRLTHSLIVAVVLGAGGWWWYQTSVLGVIPLGLAYAILVHDLGDVVTPMGVPLLYPLSRRSFGVPMPLAAMGEGLISAVAIISGFVLWQIER